MATIALGIVGGIIGAQFGNPMLGFQVGVAVGGAIDASTIKQQTQSVGRLSDLRLSGSSYGVMIAQCWGEYRVAANIIDYKTDAAGNFLIESSKKKSSKTTGTQRVYSYSASVAQMLCRGPMGVGRIWAADRTLYDPYAYPPTPYTLRLYRGTETQQPDSLLVAQHTLAFTPAYRGTCYVMLQDLPLGDFGNALPQPFNAEVSDQLYSELVLRTAGLYLYYPFEEEFGRLADQGPKGYHLAQTNPPATVVRGCFQARNGPTGGGRGLKNSGALHHDAVAGTDANLQGPLLSVEGWFQYKGDPISGNPNVKFRYINPSTGEFSWQLSVQPDLFGPNTLVTLQLNPTAAGFTQVWQTSFLRDTLWHHVVATYDTLGATQLFLDGVRVVNVAVPVSNLAITASAGNLVTLFGGDYNVDELAFYNVILGQQDVTAHYNEAVTGGGHDWTKPTVKTFLNDLFLQCGLSPL